MAVGRLLFVRRNGKNRNKIQRIVRVGVRVYSFLKYTEINSIGKSNTTSYSSYSNVGI